jgi:hypothetical protein
LFQPSERSNISRSTPFKAKIGLLAGSVTELGSSVSELKSENQNLSSTASTSVNGNLSGLIPALTLHISALNQRNLTAAYSEYAPNAFMVWEGVTQGYGGAYSGREINYTLEDFIEIPVFINFTISSLDSPYTLDGTVYIGANISFVGLGHEAGNFNGTILANYSYIDLNGVWLISQETWNFVGFTTEYYGEACC